MTVKNKITAVITAFVLSVSSLCLTVMADETNTSTPKMCIRDSSKGVRCSAIMRPVVDREIGVSASIRRQKTVAITRDNLLKSNTALAEELDFLTICVNSGVSVGYAGGTGSGKTTDMGVLLKNIPYDKRIYSIEDSRELDLIAKDDNGKVLRCV